jgi:hypothetical protein
MRPSQTLTGFASRKHAAWLIAVLLAAAACGAPAAPASAASGAEVDVLEYVIGDTALWPRRGSQAQNQIADGTRPEVCWTKYGNSRRFECWRWNDQYIFHAVDHALDGDSDESYFFTDARWLPRFIPASATAAAPWTLDVADNAVVWFDAACRQDPSRSHGFPYRLRAWIEPQVDGGADIGVRETLIFEYEPYDPANVTGVTPERFYFARGAGWYRWQHAAAIVLFNRIGGPATKMDRSAWCAGANP